MEKGGGVCAQLWLTSHRALVPPSTPDPRALASVCLAEARGSLAPPPNDAISCGRVNGGSNLPPCTAPTLITTC